MLQKGTSGVLTNATSTKEGHGSIVVMVTIVVGEAVVAVCFLQVVTLHDHIWDLTCRQGLCGRGTGGHSLLHMWR